jgi:histidinol-phosphatase (PHP family)
MYKTDYHIHTTLSDGKASPEEYIPAARTAGLQEIGFSEHLYLSVPEPDWNIDIKRINDYLHLVDDLAAANPEILIRKALEIDFIPGKEKETGAFLENISLDYRIGSVHKNAGESFFDAASYVRSGKNDDTLFSNYFEIINMAASSGLFDIIGHCDYIRILGIKPSKNPEPYYRAIAKTMKKYDVAFELNTNGMNKLVSDFYPDRRFLHIFREEKVPVCVNSDAHMPSRVAQYFDEAYRLLKSAGYNEMARFEKRKRYMVPF